MSFKIVKTIERGCPKLNIVPAQWESNGLLKWPKIGANWLAKDQHSTPSFGWLKMNCTVKKRNIVSYAAAEKTLESLYDTDSDMESHNAGVKKTDAMDIQLEEHCGNFSPSSNDYKDGQPSDTVAWPLLSEDSASATSAPAADLQKILDNQTILFDVTNKIVENQKKIMNKLEKLSAQMHDSFMKIHNLNTFTVSLEQALSSEHKADDTMVLRPISNAQELDDMEHLLADSENRKKFKNSCLFLCSGGPKTGPNCAYRFVDVVFTRAFLCTCSWAGGSRTEDVKIGLKAYKNVLGFFFEMINHWDPCYTQEENENFFKRILKNAFQRKLSKGQRVSVIKHRSKRVKRAIEKNIVDGTNDGHKDDKGTEAVTN